MVEYNNILNMISLLLAFIILFIILFGCKCNSCITPTTIKEKFENNEEKKEEEDLSKFEKSILEGLSSGTITTKDLSSLIKV
jgi:hypothetical protein